MNKVLLPVLVGLVLSLGITTQNAYAGIDPEITAIHCEDLDIYLEEGDVYGEGYCDIEFTFGDDLEVPVYFDGSYGTEDDCIDELELTFYEDYEDPLGEFEVEFNEFSTCIDEHDFEGEFSGLGEVKDADGTFEGIESLFASIMGELEFYYYEGEGTISIWLTEEEPEPLPEPPQVVEVHCDVEYDFEMFLIWGEREGYGECIYIFSDGSEEHVEVHVGGEFEVGSLVEGFRTIEGTFHIEDYDDNALWLFEEGAIEIDCETETEPEPEETAYCLETEATVEEGEGIFDDIDGEGTRTAFGYFVTEFIFTEGYAYSTIWLFFDCPECEPEVEPEAEEQDGGGGCTNCEPPTLGLNKEGDQRMVDRGFTCNGQSSDVEHYYTEFPLITNRVGQPLSCSFVIYEDTGADNIRHFEFAVGKRAGDSMSEVQGKIVWDRNHLLVETLTYDEDLFRDVSVYPAGLTTCTNESGTPTCLLLTLRATPTAPLVEDIIVKTNVWDDRRNAKQNFYNDGIDFVGNTESHPPYFTVVDGKNGLTTIYTTDFTLEDTTHAIDQYGRTWTHNGVEWQVDYTAPDRSCDVSSYIGYDRTCPEFAIMKEGQALLAQQYFDSSKIQSTVPDAYTFEYPEQTDRLEGTQLRD
ncbi:MAG: hypothetical protein V3V41_02050 [Candidatus Heimdallarchaeota archaeon]